MKNYKSILLVSLSIIALNNSHVTQTHDDEWPRFINWFFNSGPESPYEDHLNQFRNDLGGIPQRDIDSIIFIARRKLTAKKPENDYHINQLMREAIVDQIRIITIDMAERYTNNREEIVSSVRSMVGNVKVRLDRGDNLNGLALKQFFNRDSLRKLVRQNVKNPYNSQPTYNEQPIYSFQPVQKPAPIKQPKQTAYHPSGDDFLRQIQHDLKGIPASDINAIVATGRQELLRKKPTNDHKKNNIMREVIINRVRMNTRSIANQLTKDSTLIDNTVRSMSRNVKARLARGDNLDGQALAQFFGPNLERMVKQNINSTQSSDKVDHSKPAPEQFAPSAPPALFTSSASEKPKQEKDNKCFYCFEGKADLLKNNIQLGDIKRCPNGKKHSDQICPSCESGLGETCPLCREKLRR